MKPEEIKKLMIESTDPEKNTSGFPGMLEDGGISFSFGQGFSSMVLERLSQTSMVVKRETDFIRTWNLAFYRIALTGVAAIVILLISIYISEGSVSLDSLLGLVNGGDESIIGLLTGN